MILLYRIYISIKIIKEKLNFMDEIKKELLDISMLPSVRLLLAFTDKINDHAYFCSSSFLCQNC